MTTKSEPRSASDLFQGEFLAYVYSPDEILINLATAFVLALVIAFTSSGNPPRLELLAVIRAHPYFRNGNHRYGRYGNWE